MSDSGHGRPAVLWSFLTKRGLVVITLMFMTVAIVGLESKFSILSKINSVGVSASFGKLSRAYSEYGFSGLVDLIVKRTTDPMIVLSPTLQYSLLDKTSQPPQERPEERDALPVFKVIPHANVSALPAAMADDKTYSEWHRSNGDEFSTKYSAIDQVNQGNVKSLETAWVYSSGAEIDNPKLPGITVETNPIIVKDRLFFTSSDGFLISVSAVTGREIWRLKLPDPVARRGLIWESNRNFEDSRLFVPTGAGVYAIRAADGKIQEEFGVKGQVGNELSMIAPVIVGNKLIVAIVRPALEAYDIRSGKLLWSRPLLERKSDKESGLYGGVPWGGMSADSGRSMVYVSTGNPRPSVLGISRLGDNKNTCSIVAVDAEDGRIAWAFQHVAHDLWDLDIPTAPILTTITKDQRKIDVLATLTKTGNTILLSRDTGEPIFDYRLRRAPVSRVPGEVTAPYQPSIEIPEPFSKQIFEPQDVTDRSQLARENVVNKIRGARHGFFEPPVLGGSVVLYGMNGGAEWPGGAVDPRTGVLYVPSNEFPWIIRAHYMDTSATSAMAEAIPGNKLYQSKCANCHKPDRSGSYETEREGDAYFPALTGITLLRPKESLTSKAWFIQAHLGIEKVSKIESAELMLLYGYFDNLDRRSDRDRAFSYQAYWQLLLDDHGFPGSKPPWGYITAIDLNTGKHKWRVPFGQYDNVLRNGVPIKGQRNMGGVIATAGGLLFATGTVDQRIRAFNASNGEELWSSKLPAAGSTLPSTYMVNGTQYVVVVATGGSYKGYSGRSDKLIAFKLRNK